MQCTGSQPHAPTLNNCSRRLRYGGHLPQVQGLDHLLEDADCVHAGLTCFVGLPQGLQCKLPAD
jgi:hypothetical protein